VLAAAVAVAVAERRSLLLTPMTEQHKIVFTPSGLSGEVPAGTTVLHAARELGVDVDSVCGGRGLCGRCQITPVDGEFPKWGISATAVSLSPWGGLEQSYKGKRPIEDGNRLGCGAMIHGDTVIDVPPESQIHKQVVRKEVNVEDLELDPAITLNFIEIEHSVLTEGDPVLDRVAQALAADWQLARPTATPKVLRMLQAAIVGAEGRMTVAVHQPLPVDDHPAQPPRILAAWAGYVDTAVGMAVDIGSTTIAGHLIDLNSGEILATAGRMNPQIRFGEDLMSRVSYVMMNPGGDAELETAVRTALDELLGELVETANVDRSHVLDVALVGNPIMHHLLLGLDSVPLGQAPFPLATAEAVNGMASDVDIDAPAAMWVGPCIAGHVGADTAAVILSEKPYASERVSLLIDVGTNAEIVLGNSSQLFAASSPTGPAFEGAQISAGQRATAGAIERVKIDRATMEPAFKVIGSDLWSNESGFEEATQGRTKPGITGICGSGIIEVISEMYLSGVMDQNGVILGSNAERTPRIVADERTFSYHLHGDIHVTQADVRAIQLAKAALRAGIDLLLEHAQLTTVDEIKLAGAFGAHIDPTHAMVLGLIPDCPVNQVSAVGNAAGSGAVRALLSRSQRREIEDVVDRVTKIETAIEPRFQELFIAAMAFPHTTAATPNLSTLVNLPERQASAQPTRQRGRRRRATNSQESNDV